MSYFLKKLRTQYFNFENVLYADPIRTNLLYIIFKNAGISKVSQLLKGSIMSLHNVSAKTPDPPSKNPSHQRIVSPCRDHQLSWIPQSEKLLSSYNFSRICYAHKVQDDSRGDYLKINDVLF